MNNQKNVFDNTSDEEWKIKQNARRLTREYYNIDYLDTDARCRILTELFGRVGTNVNIDVPLHCNYGKRTFIGDNVIVGLNCTFVDDAQIIIGNNVLIASNVQFYTATHATAPNERYIEDWQTKGTKYFRTMSEPIKVCDRVWIGGGVIILPGVTIGENSVIGAGSVVNKSIPANCVAVGNPCRPVKFFNKT